MHPVPCFSVYRQSRQYYRQVPYSNNNWNRVNKSILGGFGIGSDRINKFTTSRTAKRKIPKIREIHCTIAQRPSEQIGTIPYTTSQY